VATVIAVVGAIALVGALLFFRGSDTYTVKAKFQNAGQLVDGNLVEIGGTKAGLVKGFELTDDSLAEVEIEIDEKYAPLHEGTKAVIRAGSQSSIANRYIELHMPPENQRGEEIDDGGTIEVTDTVTGVELDQFFSTFDRKTRKALNRFYAGNYRQYYNAGRDANRGWLYLNPQLSAASRLFKELSYDPPVLEHFLVDTSRFVTALADRREDLAPMIENLNRTTRALGDQRESLAELLERFPDFMRSANTTYVNLRSTLDEVDPFVEASKPVARKLGPYLDELRPFARDARPTVARLSKIIRKPGASNDLTELNRTYPKLVDIAVETKNRTVNFGGQDVNVGNKRGAFEEMTEAFRESAPIVAHGRAYTPDFVGWMDDFSHTGAYDAVGGFSRTLSHFNTFTASLPTPGDPPLPVDLPLEMIPVGERGNNFRSLVRIEQYKRCPGAAEERADDGSNVFTPEEMAELDCKEEHRATGAIQR
jgi:phospholipid/cholesterol/gamma-HCH transport system substrate-binding protein